jgi:PhnB protein
MEQAMQVNPYLYYSGNCEAALKFYQRVLGAQIEMMMTHESAPESMPIPPEWKKKIMHARISIDGEVIMASDAPPGRFHQPQGFSVSLQVEDPADAERKFKALAEGGRVDMPFAKTFFSNGFGMCVDQFGIPWMVICPMEE